MSRLLTAAAAGALTLGSLGAAPPAADPGGATQINTHECVGADPTLCADVNGIQNTTITPSGNQSNRFHGTTCFSFISSTGVLLDQQCFALNSHALLKDGVVEEANTRLIATFTLPGGTCTTTFHLHIASGSVQFEREASTCP